jgi:hypothetical protein
LAQEFKSPKTSKKRGPMEYAKHFELPITDSLERERLNSPRLPMKIQMGTSGLPLLGLPWRDGPIDFHISPFPDLKGGKKPSK